MRVRVAAAEARAFEAEEWVANTALREAQVRAEAVGEAVAKQVTAEAVAEAVAKQVRAEAVAVAVAEALAKAVAEVAGRGMR